MWKCPKCRERIEDAFDVCWNCGTSQSGVEDPDFQQDPSAKELADSGLQSGKAQQTDENLDPIRCARCHRPLDYVGTKAFHEGTDWGVLGNLGELFVNRERFEVYVCPRCGRVEFFVDGIGEEYRPH